MRIIFFPVFGSTNVEGLSSGSSCSSSIAAGAAGCLTPKRASARLLVALPPGAGDGEGAAVADAPGDAAGAAPDAGDAAGVDGEEEHPAAPRTRAANRAGTSTFTETP
jgi:hypothetical protein